MNRLAIYKILSLTMLIFFCILHGVSFGISNNFLELGIKKTSIGYQSDVISSLIENGIPFYIDSEGILKYQGKYKEQVDDILKELNERPEVQFSDYKFASLFIALLKKNNISFLIREGANKSNIHIVYYKKDKKYIDNVIYPEFKKLLLVGRKTGKYSYQKK